MDNALGLGVDLLAVDRMKASVDSEAFLAATFTPAERLAAAARADVVTYFAKIFAGKEAVFKSLGMSGDELESWLDIEITDAPSGAPEATLRGSCARAAAARGADHVLLSFSHDARLVLAACLLIGRHDQ
jgi:holo-[acyl-carrier protein] synthase